MSTYQFFIILHGLKDVLIWLVPLLIAILLCATALTIASRWLRARKSEVKGLAALSAKVDEMELRLAALEKHEAQAVRPADQGGAATE